ncbi:unnamed protein product [Eruca vesicaria subsp. sativa]|uniref:CLAVATA3/ESR (CLE)-related protein 9 n=1 Tax=Eruca vesicaria subsp. sativa TaxID=29727 RepID=A0ABC8M2H5_ERUVS|nr:unnamed protein product [Eruca vesicaria subsp. sativa]
MSTSHLNRQILILLVFLLLSASEENRMTSRNFPRVHHPYYVTDPNGSCNSFSGTYARSMCHELQRIHHHSSRRQPFAPAPPLEIDPRYGVDKRLVPSGPNPLHN